MKKKKENLKKREKKIFEMLYAHLMESDKYKQYCNWLREANSDLAWPEELPRSLGITFSHFGDIFSDSFDDSFKRWLDNKKRMDPGIGVIEYTQQQAVYDFNSSVKSFVESHGREPNLDEFREVFIDRLFNHLPASFLFRAHFPMNPNIDMVAQFKELLKKKEKSKEVKKFKQQWFFLGKIREDEWRRDLEAYKLKEKMTLKEVIKKLGTKAQKEDYENANVQRAFNLYIQNAKKIIKNIEQGYFTRE